ncbi:MAG: fatty acid desaturase [Pseudomonadota bacterium]
MNLATNTGKAPNTLPTGAQIGQLAEPNIVSGTDKPELSPAELARPFATASRPHALFQFTNAILLYAVAMYLMFAVLPVSYGLTLLIAPIAIIGHLRLLIIGHDCAHRSFMPTRLENTLIGNTLGVLTNTPLLYWASQHIAHHRTTGDLDRRGSGDVLIMTAEEYDNSSEWDRMWYRMHRNPWILMLIFAPIHFVFMQRLPLEHKPASKEIWRSVLGTNVGICLYYGLVIWLVGLVPFLMVYVPVVLFSSTGAVWLFYMQHQFEDAYWERSENWEYDKATFEGSSFYDLPRWGHWLCANISYHHIHHLNPRIPNYKLPACYASNPALQEAKAIRFWESLKLTRLALWDENAKRLISFKEHKQHKG